jgi:hypothetical protein
VAEWPFVDQAVGVRLAKASTWCGWRISEAAHLPRKGAFNVVEDGVHGGHEYQRQDRRGQQSADQDDRGRFGTPQPYLLTTDVVGSSPISVPPLICVDWKWTLLNVVMMAPTC